MIRRTATIAGIAAGFALLSPVAAFATGPATSTDPAPVPTTSPTAPPTTQKPPPTDPAGLHLTVTKGVPGAKIGVKITCAGKSQVTSKALALTGPTSAVVNDVAPGNYPVVMVCHGSDGTTAQDSVKFTVLPKTSTAPVEKKQVVKVPKGAAQTGDGSEAPSQGADVAQIAGGAAGAALLAGGSVALARRRYGARS